MIELPEFPSTLSMFQLKFNPGLFERRTHDLEIYMNTLLNGYYFSSHKICKNN